MEKIKQAKIILKELDKVMIIDWNMEEIYLKPILKGLEKIEKQKK